MANDSLRKSWLRLWPAALAYACFLFCLLIQNRFDWLSSSTLGRSLVVGIIIGFVGLGVIIGGTLGKNWISGWLVSCLLVFISLLCASVTDLWFGNFEVFGILFMVPLAALTSCLPLVAMRNLFGWSLTLSEGSEAARTRASVEDLFILGVVTAACISIFANVELYLGAGPENVAPITMGFTLVFGAVVGIPCVYIAFHVKSWVNRFGLWTLHSLVAVVIVVSLVVYFGEADVADTIKEVGGILAIASVIIALGCMALRVSGLRLIHIEYTADQSTHSANNQTAVSSAHPLDSQEATSKCSAANRCASSRLYPRAMTMMVVVVAGAFMVGQLITDQRNRNFWEEVKRILSNKEKHIAEIWAPNNRVTKVSVTDQFNDADLARLMARFPTIEQLDLAGSKVTGAGLARLAGATSLRVLDLSDTQITSAELSPVRGPNLSTLAIAGTPISLEQAIDIAQRWQLFWLNVGRTGITDDQLAEISGVASVCELSLAGNPITDAGLNHLSKFTSLNKLDLSDTPIDGSGLSSINGPSITRWILDGTQIIDQNLAAGSAEAVSIRRTGITAAVLPGLAARPIELILGEGPITEQDLMSLPVCTFSRLSLNHPKFTGACMTTGNLRCDHIDLSHSSVSEAELSKFNQPQLTTLDLSDTRVSLAAVIRTGAYEVIFRDNPVDNRDLFDASRELSRLIIRSSQITPEQAAQVQRVLQGVKIDEQSMWGAY